MTDTESTLHRDASGSLPSLDEFCLTGEEEALLRSQFRLIASDVRLNESKIDIRATIPRESGCYFWTLRVESEHYKIYVGRTRSMRKRFSDYANDIQIHSPNDYKLRFFQEFIHECQNAAGFDLYFTPVGDEEFKIRESQFIDQYRPLINSLRRPTPEDRARIGDAFRAYYRGAFAQSCKGVEERD